MIVVVEAETFFVCHPVQGGHLSAEGLPEIRRFASGADKLEDKDLVRIRVGDLRSVVYENVLVRVNENYRLAMHIDFDEGNACGWVPGMTGQLLPDHS